MKKNVHLRALGAAVLLLGMLVVVSVMPVAAADAQKQIVPTILKYQPVPAEPGNFVDVWLLIANQRETVRDFSITAVPEYPFSLAEDEELTRNLSAIPQTDQAVIKYRYFVDLDARNQEYNLSWAYRFDKQGGVFHYEGPITVQATDASLTVDKYTISPDPVRPGSNATITVWLKNNGKITLKDIDVTLDLGSADGFSNYGSGTVQRVKYIAPGESVEVSYHLVSDPKAEVRIYKFPVTLNFRDQRNNKYNASSKVSVIVNAKPRLMMSVSGSKLTGINSTGAVTFKVVNNGAVDLKFLTMNLEPSSQYEILSASSTDYLGNLDADDFESAEFEVRARSAAPVFSVGIEFSDPYNNRFNQSFQVPLRIVDPGSLGASGSSRYVVITLIVLVAIVVAWMAARRLRRA